MGARVTGSLVALIAALVVAGPAHADGLTAGVGRADITPQTGYYMMGWVRSDAVLHGQHTRLFARAIVLKRNHRKIALVAMDLNGIPGGIVAAAADRLKSRGFGQDNILVSASHTHAAPSGFYNFSSYNTVFMTVNSPTDFDLTGSLDPQLYAFMVRQLVQAITRADDDRGPAKAAWRSTQLLGLTQNRSLEAHLADHGIDVAPGEGNVSMDPLGYADTIDPNVEVLRVDRKIGKRYRPVGMWSTFADHGTVNKFQFDVMNADHHGAATRVVEAALRRTGHVPPGQDVVNAYGNTDEGDQSAGLVHGGPAYAEYVGDVEARAMLTAWRQAGRSLTRTPALDWRWTRICFCGQTLPQGKTSDKAVFGLAEFTGSEEGRGPLYDITHQSFEGSTSPIDDPEQGHKAQVITEGEGSIPKAVPLMALHLGDGLVVSIPGEMTVGMGRRVRDAVLAAAGPSSGIRRAVISGLANEYLSYFTSPEEYERQHYEGAATLYGKLASLVLQNGLVDLTTRLVHGQPAPAPYPYDPRNGISDDAPPFPPGAASGSITKQPGAVARLQRAQIAWNGGPRGLDRPLDKPFVSVQQRLGRQWRAVTSDLGLQILWRVDDNGGYTAEWQVPLDAATGRYRFVITANRYKLTSAPFAVSASHALTVTRVAGGVSLAYPAAVENVDLTYRPPFASGGFVTFGGRTIRQTRGTVFAVPDGAQVTAARDRFGNTAG